MRTTRCAGAAALVACAVLAGCGGGGGPPNGLSVSTTELTFTAAADAATPTAQSVSGTITGVTAESIRVDVVVTGNAVQGATFNLLGNDSGTLKISVRPPETAGVGSHTSQIQVFACTNLNGCANGAPQIPGSPKTISVEYTVKAAAPTVRYVTPHVAQVGHSTDVIIRGAGFAQLTRPNVSAGSTPALSTTFVSDTEVRATLPAMAAGSYPIQLSSSASNGVAATTQVALRVLAEPTLGYAFIAGSGSKTRVIYDAPRSALYVGNTTTGQLIRYAHSIDAVTRAPVWTATALSVRAPTEIAMLPDGNTLLVSSVEDVVHINLDSFAASRTVAIEPLLGDFVESLCVANNGIVFIVPTVYGTGAGRSLRYNSRLGTFTLEEPSISLSRTADQSTCAAAGNGSKVFITTNLNQHVFQYDATTNAALALSSVRASGNSAQSDATGDTLLVGAVDFHTDRTVFRGSVALGKLPGSNVNPRRLASLLTADGRTVYSYHAASRFVDVYDVTALSGGRFAAKPSVALAGPHSVGSDLTLTRGLTPFGKTLFIVGSDGILVQPLP